MSDIASLQKELETLDSKMSVYAESILAIDEEIHHVDLAIKDLELKKGQLRTKRDLEVADEEATMKRLEEVKKQLEEAVKGVDFFDALKDLVGGYLETLPLAELRKINEGLKSYRPIRPVAKEQEDLPWNDAPYTGPIDEGVPIGEDDAPSPPRVFPNWVADAGVDCSGDVPKMMMMDLNVVGQFFRFAREQKVKHFEFVIHLDGKEYRVVDEMLLPVSMMTGKRCKSHTERERRLYHLAFMYWLESKYGKLSARDVFDYLVGCDCIEDGVKYVPNFRAGNSLPRWYRLVAPNGETVLEVKGNCEEKEMYVAYSDSEGYRIIAKFIGFTTFENVAPEMFSAYFSDRQHYNHRAEMCKGIDFREIFKDAYFTIEEVG